MQKKIVSMVGFIVALMLIGCSDSSGGYYVDDLNNNNQPAVNNNNGGTNTNDTNTNDNTCCEDEPTFTAWSSDMLATWVQKQDGSVEFGPVLTPETCDGEHARYDYYVTSRPMVFIFSASTDLTIQSTIPLEVYYVNQDPDDPWSFWVLEFEVREFYGLDPYWHVDRFPTSWAQAEGFKYTASAFICGEQINAINLGCYNQFEGAFFESRGSHLSFNFEEQPEDSGEIFVLAVVR